MSNILLDLIDLDQKKTGYRQFLSCWAFSGPDVSFIVDPGPSSSTGYLLDMLGNTNFSRLDFILLTHIHLDHAGGLAAVLEKYPDAKVFCHKSGIKHLVDPSRLWQGSLKVLGDVGHMYGEPLPVPESAFTDEKELEKRGISVIETPGHAPHHVCFVTNDILFAGEAIGTHLDLPSGKPYLRPATPPRFILEEALSSLDRLLALDKEPAHCAFAHYGMSTDTFEWLRRAKKQLVLWVDTIRDLYAESEDNLEQRLFDRLMEVDPLYGQGRYDELPDDLRKRERHFLANSLDGMLGYIKSSETPRDKL